MPWRLAVYYRQSRDERVRPLLAAMVEFFERQEVLAAGYTLDGRPLTDYPDLCFLAPAWGLLQASFPVSVLKLDFACDSQHSAHLVISYIKLSGNAILTALI